MLTFARHWLWYPRLFKFSIVFLMLVNLGIGRWLSGVWQEEHNAMSGAEFRSASIVFNVWLDSLATASQAKESYGITEYFQDLRQIRLKEAQILNDVHPGCDISNKMAILQEKANKSSTREQKCFEYNKYEEWEIQQGLVQPAKPADWSRVSRWFWLLYIHNLPIAFAYLLIVCLQNRKIRLQRKWMPNPARFALAVLGYPVTFFFLARASSRTWQFEGEYRRTLKNVFGDLTPEEVERLRVLAQSSLKLCQWRSMLKSEGRFPRRSYALAALATLALAMVGRNVDADAISIVWFTSGAVIEQTIGDSLPRMSIADDESDSQPQPSFPSSAMMHWTVNIFRKMFVLYLVWLRDRVKPTRRARAIDHVPRFRPSRCWGFHTIQHHTGQAGGDLLPA